MSNEQEPVAWTVGYGGSGGYFTDDERKADSWRDAGATVTPLYRHPQTTLTDEERDAIVHLCNHAKWSDGCDNLDAAAATIVEGFLKRIGE